jgi:hypothetical protein
MVAPHGTACAFARPQLAQSQAAAVARTAFRHRHHQCPASAARLLRMGQRRLQQNLQVGRDLRGALWQVVKR